MVNEVKIWPWTDEPWYVAQTVRWNAMIADGWTFQPPLPRTGYIGMEMTLLDNLAWPLRSHSIWLSRDNQMPEELHSAILEWCESQARASTPSPSVPAGDEPHPEDSCKQCGGPNVVWFAPNDLWNQYVRAAGLPEIICPICFIKAAEGAGRSECAWRIQPGGYVDAAAPSTPSASVPGEHQYRGDLWIDPDGTTNFKFHIPGGDFTAARHVLQKFIKCLQDKLNRAEDCPYAERVLNHCDECGKDFYYSYEGNICPPCFGRLRGNV